MLRSREEKMEQEVDTEPSALANLEEGTLVSDFTVRQYVTRSQTPLFSSLLQLIHTSALPEHYHLLLSSVCLACMTPPSPHGKRPPQPASTAGRRSRLYFPVSSFVCSAFQTYCCWSLRGWKEVEVKRRTGWTVRRAAGGDEGGRL